MQPERRLRPAGGPAAPGSQRRAAWLAALAILVVAVTAAAGWQGDRRPAHAMSRVTPVPTAGSASGRAAIDEPSPIPPAASRLAGKCVARETLTVLKRSSSDEVFRKIVWGNVHERLRIPA